MSDARHTHCRKTFSASIARAWVDALARSTGLALFAMLCLTSLRSTAAANAFGASTPDQNESVEAGHESLSRSAYPWYDAQADDVRRIDVQPALKPAQLNSSSSSMSSWGDVGIMQILAWTAICLLLALLAYLLIRTFLQREAGQVQDFQPVTTRAAGTIDRVQELPFQVRRPESDLLSEARRHYQQGDFREAIVYLYSYQLVELDKHQWIRLTKGKTNRQYLHELDGRGPLQPLVEKTMVAFEDVFFGDLPLSSSRFEECWRMLDQFNALVARRST